MPGMGFFWKVLPNMQKIVQSAPGAFRPIVLYRASWASGGAKSGSLRNKTNDPKFAT
jgi:hypothetical protein